MSDERRVLMARLVMAMRSPKAKEAALAAAMDLEMPDDGLDRLDKLWELVEEIVVEIFTMPKATKARESTQKRRATLSISDDASDMLEGFMERTGLSRSAATEVAICRMLLGRETTSPAQRVRLQQIIDERMRGLEE